MISGLKSAIRDRIHQHYGVPRIDFAMDRFSEQDFSPDLIFDIGAYEGEFAQICREVWPSSHIACFEPQEEAAAKLRDDADQEMSVYSVLLGSQNKGEVSLHRAGTASSVLDEHEESHHTSMHEMRTVDTVVTEDFNGQAPDLIKLDVQGYELEVLKGAEDALDSASAVLAEVNLIDIHEGASLFTEVVEWLEQRDFVAFDICGLHRRPLDDALWQADMIFVPRDFSIREDKRWQS
jgi:FkbM family methyltransferase